MTRAEQLGLGLAGKWSGFLDEPPESWPEILAQPTVRRWLNLLETSYQLVRLPAYAVNRTKRLMKTPKAYGSDTGLALRVAGGKEPEGPHLENLLLTDFLAWRDSRVLDRPEVFYWRNAAGEEVDLVVERGQDLLGIEVKATTRPSLRDIRHLVAFRKEYGERVRGCFLIHGGDKVEWLGSRILSLPWWRVISKAFGTGHCWSPGIDKRGQSPHEFLTNLSRRNHTLAEETG